MSDKSTALSTSFPYTSERGENYLILTVGTKERSPLTNQFPDKPLVHIIKGGSLEDIPKEALTLPFEDLQVLLEAPLIQGEYGKLTQRDLKEIFRLVNKIVWERRFERAEALGHKHSVDIEFASEEVDWDY